MPPKTSGKAAVKSGKSAKAAPKGEKKKKKGKRKESYAIYIYKVCVENIFFALNSVELVSTPARRNQSSGQRKFSTHTL